MFKDVAGAFTGYATVPAQVRHLTDRAVRIALGQRRVTALIFPNDLQDVPMEQPPEVASYIAKWQTAERQFFDIINVEQAVSIIGMMPGITEKRDSAIYSYDAQTLKRLGLHIEFAGAQTGMSASGEKLAQVFELEESVLNHFLMLNDIVSEELIN